MVRIKHMKVDVNTQNQSRRYDSSRRKAAARQTRHNIVTVARKLFLERGYAGTTMSAIADSTGVALDTVYATIGPKPVLFRHLIEIAISGEDEPVSAEERDYVQDIRAEPDPRLKLARYARAIRQIHARLAPLVRLLKDAARDDPQLAELWSEIAERRAANMRLFVADVASAGGLRNGVSEDEAADVIWATNAPEFYLLLVEERGWEPERFERWLAQSWARLLLP